MRAWLEEHHSGIVGEPQKGVTLVPSGQLSKFPKYRRYFGEDRIYWIILREQLTRRSLKTFRRYFRRHLAIPLCRPMRSPGPALTFNPPRRLVRWWHAN